MITGFKMIDLLYYSKFTDLPKHITLWNLLHNVPLDDMLFEKMRFLSQSQTPEQWTLQYIVSKLRYLERDKNISFPAKL